MWEIHFFFLTLGPKILSIYESSLLQSIYLQRLCCTAGFTFEDAELWGEPSTELLGVWLVIKLDLSIEGETTFYKCSYYKST